MTRVENVIKALEKNNMQGFYVKSIEEAIEKIKEIVPKGAVAALGGSMTMMKTPLMDHIMSGRYNVLDRYKEGITQEEINVLFREAFMADVLFTGTNAITENGELYNIDGIGNRVAAMIFGPASVVVMVGSNKLVKDMDEAKNRMKTIAAPLNAKRLNRNTPCSITGVCEDCKSPERICAHEVVMKQQMFKDRVKVIIIEGDYGF